MVSAALSGGCGGYTLFEGSPDHLSPVISEEFHQLVLAAPSDAISIWMS